jgi:hypothetical protein
MREIPKTVTLSEPVVAGKWDVEPLEGGDFLLRRRLTSLDEIRERQGGRPMTPEEFERHFGHLPRDGEG